MVLNRRYVAYANGVLEGLRTQRNESGLKVVTFLVEDKTSRVADYILGELKIDPDFQGISFHKSWGSKRRGVLPKGHMEIELGNID